MLFTRPIVLPSGKNAHNLKLLNHFQVARQHEPQLIKAINKLCDGQLDDGVEEFVEGLSRPLDDDSDACRMFGTKFDAM